jgi:serine/threonine protein kinase
VANINNARHPNLISLVGACMEAHALVYEYAPHGSLEDYLHRKNHSMIWQVRARVLSELCSVLTYLHSTQPNPISHGNIKPSNILFNSSYSIKLSDLYLGMSISQNYTSRKSTVAYVEPELLATSQLMPACDMYSFGVLLLVLLTGRPAFRVKKVVQEALDKETMQEVLDRSAGDWPLEETKELAKLALRSCDIERGCRPLVEEVNMVVESLMNAAKASKFRSWSIGSNSECGGSVPSYFMCPILKVCIFHFSGKKNTLGYQNFYHLSKSSKYAI